MRNKKMAYDKLVNDIMEYEGSNSGANDIYYNCNNILTDAIETMKEGLNTYITEAFENKIKDDIQFYNEMLVKFKSL